MTSPVQYHYGNFPPANIDWTRLIPLIGPASAALARYDGTLAAIPNAFVLLSPLTTQEAVLSSKIEGTQTTMGEVLEFEAEGDSEKISQERKADINEVLNYRKAMWHAGI
jgi:Fic family protein